MLDQIRQQIEQARSEFATAAGAQLEAIRIKYLGGQGLVKAAKKLIGQADPGDRPAIGKLASEFEAACKEAFELAKARLGGAAAQKPGGPLRDWTLFPEYAPGGSLHPITKMIHLMTDSLAKLGFEVAVGPEVETAYHNFEALNIPIWHPARDSHDTFYLQREGKNPTGEPLLLRTHTSPVQVRHLLAHKPPARIITLGRCYRADPIDATHHATFHQIEGLYVDKNVSMADLKGVLSELCRAAFGSETRTRFRPSFFPFVEPGAEVDAEIVNRRGERRWIELGGCGMVHPQVLTNVSIDPEVYSGFAFGMGIERFLILRHQDQEQLDLRHFLESDVRVLRQFA
ncbi:MAG TPA: phenylalanine--tRNA ligase subunit alpha [Planctomycetota bacterium]|nr:phenylalanine--tRNA ligase subunit alpha [Planctomycetota bacterium]